jgi:hypothetical protein
MARRMGDTLLRVDQTNTLIKFGSAFRAPDLAQLVVGTPVGSRKQVPPCGIVWRKRPRKEC